MSNFNQTPQLVDPLASESLNQLSYNYRIDNIDFKYYVYLVNGNGDYLGLTTDAIELLDIEDNILEIAPSATCVLRNDNDSIERSNYNIQIGQGENYFARQPKNQESTAIDQFFFRNDCRDFLYVFIQPNLNELLEGQNIDKLTPLSTLFYTFSVLENEDIISENGNNKFKKLSLVDADLEILREKNTNFSSSTLKNEINLTQEGNSKRSSYTGEILKDLLIKGLDIGGSGQKTEQNGSVINNDLFELGSTNLFYSSPGEYSILDDINYVLKRHTSASYPNDPCLLRKDRYSGQYTLISYKDYFKNAIFQSKSGMSSGGFSHLETILLGEEGNTSPSNEIKKRTPFLPFNNITIGDYSMVDKFEFQNMNGIDSQSKIVSTAVHSYQIKEKQFQIDSSNNNVVRSLTDFYSYFIKGTEDEDLFLSDKISTNIFVNQLRKNNLNFKNVFSINDTEPDQRLGLGRNEILKNALFLNNAISLKLKGLTFRSAGKFFSFDRKAGGKDSIFDDKVFGTYFLAKINHVFTKGSYSNNLVGIKTYMYNMPKVKEVV